MDEEGGSLNLTPHQRSRIALQKSLALARRSMLEAHQCSSTSERIIRTQLFSPKEETLTRPKVNGTFNSTLTAKLPASYVDAVNHQQLSVPTVSSYERGIAEFSELDNLKLCTMGSTENLTIRTVEEFLCHEPTENSTVGSNETVLSHANTKNIKFRAEQVVSGHGSTENFTVRAREEDFEHQYMESVRDETKSTESIVEKTPYRSQIGLFGGLKQCKSIDTINGTSNIVNTINFSDTLQRGRTDIMDTDTIHGTNFGSTAECRIDSFHSGTMCTQTINGVRFRSIPQCRTADTVDAETVCEIGFSGLRSPQQCGNDTIPDTEAKEKYSPSTILSGHTGKIKLSKQQLEVLKAVAARKSVFITGSAGTGKSFILGCIIRILKKRFGPEAVYVTASTGLAACALGGVTLHSFAGIGLGNDDAETMVAKVMGKQEARERWRHAEVLIIDEISMIDGDLFDKLDYVAKIIRKKKVGNRYRSCFGGLQLIVTGDFFQLPPVKATNLMKYFAFEAECWDKCFDLQIELKHAFRHSEGSFVEMLNEIRKGSPTYQTLQNLMNAQRVLPDGGLGIVPTRLYPLKVDVKEENMKELRALNKESLTFTALDMAESPVFEVMLNTMRAEKELEICVGAQVMLIVNYDTKVGLVNGAKGIVVGFDSLPHKEGDMKEEIARRVSSTLKWPVVMFYCDRIERIIGPETLTLECGGREVVKRIQVPLILAWALSVHKCQGMTLDRVQTDLSKAFDYGMIYVALSRVKKLDGLQLLGFDHTKIKVHPNVVRFYAKLSKCRGDHPK